jgi:hypothetical protein
MNSMGVRRIAVSFESVGECKTMCSQFYAVVLWLVGIKVHCDAFPAMMMWRELETVAAEREYAAGLRVEPLRCHNPPTAHRARFYLNLGDGGFDSPIKYVPERVYQRKYTRNGFTLVLNTYKNSEKLREAWRKTEKNYVSMRFLPLT